MSKKVWAFDHSLCGALAVEFACPVDGFPMQCSDVSRTASQGFSPAVPVTTGALDPRQSGKPWFAADASSTESEARLQASLQAPGPASPPAAAVVSGAMVCGSGAATHLEACSSGSVSHLIPEAQGMPPSGLSAGQLDLHLPGTAAGVLDSDSEAGDDLSGFLADLKSKYGLADPLDVLPVPCAADTSSQSLAVNISVVPLSPGERSSSPPSLKRSPPPPSPGCWGLGLGHAAASNRRLVPERDFGTDVAPEGSSCGKVDGDMVSDLPPPWWQTASNPDLSSGLDSTAPLQGASGQVQVQGNPGQQQGEQGEGTDAGMSSTDGGNGGRQHDADAPLGQQHGPEPYLPNSNIKFSGATEPGHKALPQRLTQRQLPWQSLHTLLVQHGFLGLLVSSEPSPQEPDPAAVFESLHSLLQEHVRCSAHQQRLGEAAQVAARRESMLVASFTAEARKKNAEVAKWKRLALDNQVAARDAQRSSQRCQGASGQLAAEARRLEALVSRQQHTLSIQEGEVERLKQALASQREREERRQHADREAYERLKHAYVVSKAADTPGGAAAALKTATRELKPLDILRIFEAERANLQEAAAVAAAEGQAAQAQLARAQEVLHAAGLPCEQFDEIEGQARAAARRAAAAEEQAAMLVEEVTALRQELAARPTQTQLNSLQRQANIMERELANAVAKKAAVEAKDAGRRPNSKQLSTREMVQRDRTMERLGLHCVEELPKPVLVALVQDACSLLECRQPLELCAAIRPVQDLAALVPRMERFIGDVCGAVFRRGLAHVPAALRQDNPSDVPAVLAAWIAELSELVEMRGVLRAVLQQLARRVSVRPTDMPPAAGEVVPLIASLVDLEHKVYHSQEVVEAAEAALVAQPDILINRICLQFQRLFGCHSLGGILPAMNKLYLAHTEAQTFLTSLRAALGLGQTATLEACANRMEQVLAGSRGALATMLPDREPHAAVSALPGSATAVVVEVVPQRQGLQEAAQVAVERMAAKRGWPQVQIFVPGGGEKSECS